MKTVPEHWTNAQIAFFTGLLSSRINIGHLKKIIEALSATVPTTHELYFQSFLAVLEPRITAYQWKVCVETCERLFS